jgi:hypothetical protein
MSSKETVPKNKERSATEQLMRFGATVLGIIFGIELFKHS